jgi:hypothetical protein
VWPELAGVTPQVAEQMEIEATYAGYLDRQEADIVAFRKDEDMRLPADLDYRAMGGLSNEAKDKLSAVRPATLGQAARIEGMTPGAITAVLAKKRPEVGGEGRREGGEPAFGNSTRMIGSLRARGGMAEACELHACDGRRWFWPG